MLTPGIGRSVDPFFDGVTQIRKSRLHPSVATTAGKVTTRKVRLIGMATRMMPASAPKIEPIFCRLDADPIPSDRTLEG